VQLKCDTHREYSPRHLVHKRSDSPPLRRGLRLVARSHRPAAVTRCRSGGSSQSNASGAAGYSERGSESGWINPAAEPCSWDFAPCYFMAHTMETGRILPPKLPFGPGSGFVAPVFALLNRGDYLRHSGLACPPGVPQDWPETEHSDRLTGSCTISSPSAAPRPIPVKDAQRHRASARSTLVSAGTSARPVPA
jgi:hypothetical protein